MIVTTIFSIPIIISLYLEFYFVAAFFGMWLLVGTAIHDVMNSRLPKGLRNFSAIAAGLLAFTSIIVLLFGLFWGNPGEGVLCGCLCAIWALCMHALGALTETFEEWM